MHDLIYFIDNNLIYVYCRVALKRTYIRAQQMKAFSQINQVAIKKNGHKEKEKQK